MGLYKRCQHKGRRRDRCEHEWRGSFQHQASLYRTSLSKWANEDIKSKQQAQAIYERYRRAVRDGRVSRIEDRRDVPRTFDELADRYVELYVKPRGLRTAEDIDTGSSRCAASSDRRRSSQSRRRTWRTSSAICASRGWSIVRRTAHCVLRQSTAVLLSSGTCSSGLWRAIPRAHAVSTRVCDADSTFSGGQQAAASCVGG